MKEKIMKAVSRSLLAAMALAYGVVATAPAWASTGTHEPLRICIKVLKEHKCIKI